MEKKAKSTKSIRFDSNLLKLEEEKDKEKLSKALEQITKQKEDLYKISVEYQKICQKELQKSQVLIAEVERLNKELLIKNSELEKKDIKLKQLMKKIVNNKEQKWLEKSGFTLLQHKFEAFYSKIAGNKYTHKIFIEKVGNWANLINEYDIEKLVSNLLQFVEELLPHIKVGMHRKQESYDEKSYNPAFFTTTSTKTKPQYISSISEHIEKNISTSKNIIKDCVDTLESNYSSSLSNFSTTSGSFKPKIRVYRRQSAFSET